MDRAEDLIRNARPPEEPLSTRAEADLASILATTTDRTSASPVRPHRGQARWVLVAAAAVVIALAVVGVSLIRPEKAVAATPPMPAFTSTGQDAPSVLANLKARAAAAPDRSSAREIVAQWWALASDVDASGTITSSSIDPRRRVTTLGPDGIVGYTDYAAQPFGADGRPIDDPTAPTPGTLLDTVTVDADQRIFTDPPPTQPAEVGPYLAAHLPLTSSSPTVNAFSGIRGLLAERVLKPAEQAAFLGYLAGLRDIQVLGTSTDRLGRPVIVFAAPPEKEYQTLLMLSPDTGQIAATEVIYLGEERSDIPTPAVVEYVVWEAD